MPSRARKGRSSTWAVLASLAAVTVVTEVASAGPVSAEGPSPSPAPSAATPAPTATATPSYTDTVDASGVHQIVLSDGAAPPAATFPAGEAWYRAHVSFTQSDGTARQYLVAVPAGLDGPAPYVFAFHAYAQGASAAMAQQDWEALAPTGRFVVVYGAGSPDASWNAGVCCGRASTSDRDDSLYVSSIIGLTAGTWPVDARRVDLAGFSNGGMLAYRYACEHPEQIAAIGIVSGTDENTARCSPSQPVAVRHLHGDADTTVPYAGSAFATRSFCTCALTPVPDVLAAWQRADSTSSWAVVSSTLVPGMGHTWPTGTTYGIDATRDLWSFFAAHPRP